MEKYKRAERRILERISQPKLNNNGFTHTLASVNDRTRQKTCLQPKKKRIKKTKNKKNLSVNAFSTKVMIEDSIFTSPTGDWTAILRGRPSHGKV